MLYQNEYVWLVFLSTLDIVLTAIILHFGGRETNQLADRVLYRFGIPGIVAYKFALIVLVVIICEVVGRHRPRTGRLLVRLGLGLSCVPIVVSLALLVNSVYGGDGQRSRIGSLYPPTILISIWRCRGPSNSQK